MVDDKTRCRVLKEWTAFLETQANVVGKDAIDRWARTLKIVHFDAGNLYLEASDPFQESWFEQYLRPLIKQSLHTASGRAIRVHLTLQGATPEMKQAQKKPWKPPLELQPDPLYTTCTFDTYFAGETSDFNVKLFHESTLKKTYNPIYIHGAANVGKTHLLMAACHLIKEQGRSVFFVKADRFTQHLVAAIRSGSMKPLRELYRKHDALVIDEIETLAGRSASQEELFHTFNSLHLAGKQIILSGTAPPSQLKEIEPRLTSRFEWGLVLSFKPLTHSELKTYLLTRKKLAPEIVDTLLTLFTTIPSLNRAVDIIQSRAPIVPTPALLQTWLAPLLKEQQKRALTTDTILEAVASHFDIHLTDLQGKSQTQEHAAPRQIAMYLCRSQLHLPYMKIADLFSRDHSTVMTSVKLIDKRLQDNPTIQASIQSIIHALHEHQ